MPCCCCSCKCDETMSLNCGHKWAYCSSPTSYMSMESHGGIDYRGKPNNSKKNLSQCRFVRHKSHMDWPGHEPGPPLWQVAGWLPEPWHCRSSCLVRYIKARERTVRDTLQCFWSLCVWKFYRAAAHLCAIVHSDNFIRELWPFLW
jgi:hypothetical protein